MNLRNVLTVFLKELRDTLRDRRAIISMFIVPTILMPAVILGFGALSMKVVKKAQQEKPAIMVLGGQDSPALQQALAAHTAFTVVPPSTDYADQISAKTLRAAVEIPRGFDAALEAGERATITIYTHSGEMRSSFATSALERFFSEYRQRIMRERLTARGLPADFTRPFDVKTENVAPPEKVGGSVFGGFVPYLLILLCFTGAMYPAIDLTAGEKERGTMETILCSPAARIDLVLGKVLVVLTASLATVACSVSSLLVTVLIAGAGFLRGIANTAPGGALPTVSLPGVIGVVALVLPLAVLFSAMLMTIALFAKTHKEAQTYISPLIFIVILPAVAALLPGVELTATLSLVPVLNIALVSKELVAGNFPLGSIALIFGSTCVYAAAALALAVRMFNREDVIFRT